MRKKLVVVLAMLCVLAFCMAPAAASSFEKGKTVGLIISPLDDLIITTKSLMTGSISSGESTTYTYYVPTGSTNLDVQLSWNNPSNNLGLKITSPTSVTYGEFDDYYDSTTANAKITLELQAGSSYLTSGTWKFIIRGKSVSGTESFNLIVNDY